MDEHLKQLESLISDGLKKAIEEASELHVRRTLGAISNIHTAGEARILKVVDKLLANGYRNDVVLRDSPVDSGTPLLNSSQDRWDLSMGDKVWVRPGLPLSEFKLASQKTVGWGSMHDKVLGKVGFITSICSPYDCHVQVLFPEIPVLAELYAGLLDKTDEDPAFENRTRFLPGDMVVIKAPHSTVQLLQRGYEKNNILEGFLGKYGRVIAVDCKRAVHVTFSGTFTLRINPALLQREDGELELGAFENSKGITQDDEVVVTKRLKKLIEAQKKINEWEGWMSRLPGKTLRVLLVKQDDLLRVCIKAGRSFNISTDVVSKKGAELEEEESSDDEGLYEIGEWVLVEKTKEMVKFLQEKNIPLSFLEYLQKPAKVNAYDKDVDAGITFDSMFTITVPYSVLNRATDAEKAEAKEIEKAVSGLKIGDEVILNLGPQNYVRDVLREHGYSHTVVEMMTSTAVLKGFLGPKHAVIEYSDGIHRKVNRVYLTVPKKFQSPRKLKLSSDLSQTNNIELIVEKCLEELNASPDSQIESRIKSMYVEKGQPSTIRLGIRSHLVDAAAVTSALESSAMKFRPLSDSLLHVSEVNGTPVDLLVHLDFDCLPAPKAPLQLPKKMEPREKAFPEESKCKDEGNVLFEKNRSQEMPASSEVKSRPGPTPEQPTNEEQAQQDLFAGYRHVGVDLDGRRIEIPYRNADQAPDSARSRRAEPAALPLSRITVEGQFTEVQLE